MAGRLRPVPERAPRALGVIRVSRERDGMMSPDVQRASITDYCRARGYEVVDWVEGLDESGSKARSAWWPRLDAAAEQVEAGDFDVIVVWKFSRTARNRLKWAVVLDRVETAGGRIESATEQVDTTTSTGRFTRGMLAELNAFEAERIGEVWHEVHENRLNRGLVPNGSRRLGYLAISGGAHQVDPEQGPIIAEAFERYAAGASFLSIVKWLDVVGVRTVRGNPIDGSVLRKYMDSGFAAGYVAWGGALHPGAHEPLITQELWQRYLDRRATNASVPRRARSSPYLLSGLMRCAKCGGPMGGSKGPTGSPPRWRCIRRNTFGRQACDSSLVSQAHTDALVLGWIRSVAAGVDEATREAELESVAKISTEAEIRRASDEVVRLDAALERLTVQLAEQLVPPDAYPAARDALLKRRAAAASRADDLALQLRIRVNDRPAAARRLVDGWLTIPLEEKRAALRELIQHIEATTTPIKARKGVAGGSSSATLVLVDADGVRHAL